MGADPPTRFRQRHIQRYKISRNLIEHGEFEARLNKLLEVPHAEVAHSDTADLTVSLGLERGLPAFASFFWAADGRVQKEQVDIAEATRLNRALDRRHRRRLAAICAQLRREEYLRARRSCRVAEVEDRTSALAFVEVPFCRVLFERRRILRSVSIQEPDLRCGGNLPANTNLNPCASERKGMCGRLTSNAHFTAEYASRPSISYVPVANALQRWVQINVTTNIHSPKPMMGI